MNIQYSYKSNIALNIIICLLIITNIVIICLNKNIELNKIYQNAFTISKELEYKTQEGINSIEYFNVVAKIILEQKNEIKYSSRLKLMDENGHYGLDEGFENNILFEDKLNVTGYGGIKNDENTQNEIEMALKLIPIFKTMKKQNSDFTSIYYVSNKNFISMYPFLSFSQYHLKEKEPEPEPISYAKPQNNPKGKTFFTPLYIDGANLGLMVTIGKPLYLNGIYMGTADLDITLKSLSLVLQKLDYLSNQSFIINKELQIIGANNVDDIDFVSNVVVANKIFNPNFLKLNSTIDKLEFIDGNYVFSYSFSNAPWKYIYIVPFYKVYEQSFYITIFIWIIILFLYYIKQLFKKLQLAKENIEAIYKKIKESINYASFIQHAIIPKKDIFEYFFKDFFVYWQPKDTVGGDIYLCEKISEDECVLFVIDCTGHGVPGAFISMLVKAIEVQIIPELSKNSSEISPSWILSYFNKTIKSLLNQENSFSNSNEGFDGGVVYLNKKTNIIKFAGANTPLFYFDEEGSLKTIKGDRYSVGNKRSDTNYIFKEHTIHSFEGISFYLSTDGYFDQNGGDNEFPFGKNRFKSIIKEYSSKSFELQKEILIKELNNYKKNKEQNDDITVIGFKL